MSAQKQTFYFAFMTRIFFPISSAILRGETSTFVSRLESLEKRQREKVSNLPRYFEFLTLLATSPAFGK